MGSSKQFAIINSDEVDNIDFSQVLETSKETLRWNNDRTKTFVKFYGDTPESVRQNCQGIYTEEGFLKLLKTDEWIIDVSYGFILKEDLQYINIIELYQNVRYTDDESMFMVTWIGDTPPALHGLLEIVVAKEEEANQILRGEWNVE